MDTIGRLTAIFEKFPGIGPRQAARFVQYLLRASPSLRHDLIESLSELTDAVHQCPDCMRFHSGKSPICGICGNSARDRTLLAVVASDTDIVALERSGTFRGMYFVLGGLMTLATDRSSNLRFTELKSASQRPGLAEIVLAFPANPEGDLTASRARELMAEGTSARITTLGRGLSTGSELEYADPETLKYALESRH